MSDVSTEINIGIIGVGNFTEAHVKAIESVKRCRLIAASRTNAAQLNAFCERYRVKAYSDYHEMLSDPKVDAVLISVPHHMHRSVAIEAAGSGKHILIEKPFALTVSDCKAINYEVLKNKVTLMVGHTSLFSSAYLKTKSIVEDGVLGSIIQIVSCSNTFWMTDHRQSWHLKKEAGGGYLMTLAIHQIAVIVGLANSEVKSIRASVSSKIHSYETDDSGVLWISFKNGIVASLTYVGYSKGIQKVESDIIFTKGMLKLDPAKGVLINGDDSWLAKEKEPADTWLHESLINEWQEFSDSIMTGKKPEIDGEFALYVIAIINAAFKSSDSNKEVWL